MKHKISIGSWITLGHFSIAEIMANAGFDWLCVDLEHSVIDYYEAEHHRPEGRSQQNASESPLLKI